MRDVVEEGVAGAERGRTDAETAIGRRVAFDERRRPCWRCRRRRADDDWAKPFAPGMNLPYGSVAQQRHVARRRDRSAGCRAGRGLRLDVGPGGRVPPSWRRRAACRWRRASAGRALSIVLAQEHLVRGMRGVGLVLVDERRRLVGVLVMSSAVPEHRRRSRRGLVARVSTMNGGASGVPVDDRADRPAAAE